VADWADVDDDERAGWQASVDVVLSATTPSPDASPDSGGRRP